VNEIGRDTRSGEVLVHVHPQFYRPAEVDLLLGNAGKAKRTFDWVSKTNVEQLAEIMVKHDIALPHA
jgi:GDPmannose 4,6-dehydratase